MFGSATLLLFAFSLIYLPAVGHGFIKDDFEWVAHSRVSVPADIIRLFTVAPSGFYRPMVSLTFAVDRWACGVHSMCYGLTNALLAIGCAIGVFALARALSLPKGAALLASAVWAFNWHGINMAVLWISGRTALVLVLFATLAATAFVRHRIAAATALTFMALLSKEEAVLLPGVLLAWTVADSAIRRNWSWSRVLPFAVSSLVVEGFYFYLRLNSGAFTPSSAPSAYRFDFSLATVLSNGREYLDRTATYAVVVTILWFLLCRPRKLGVDVNARSAIAFGVLWWLGTLAVTIFLPVRSSLYACLPSLGPALIAAALVTASSAMVSDQRLRRAVYVGMALPFLMWPIYHARNQPLTREAELSAQTLAALQQVALERGEGTVVLLHDDRSSRTPLINPFGTFIQDAADLIVTPRIRVWIDPPPDEASIAGLAARPHVDVELMLRQGAVVRKE